MDILDRLKNKLNNCYGFVSRNELELQADAIKEIESLRQQLAKPAVEEVHAKFDEWCRANNISEVVLVPYWMVWKAAYDALEEK
jgi:hypothetical protein